MASSIIKIEPLLASSMRVLRNQTTLQDLVAAYPSLKEKVLSSPKSLTESERRVFLDLPDPEMESANISAATRLSRAELIEKAVINRGSLTDAEVLVLKNRFWTPRTNDESSRLSEGFINTNDEARDEFLAVRTLAYLPKEKEAFKIRGREAYTRDRAARERPLHNATTAALPNAPEWIKQLHQEGKPHWVCIDLVVESRYFYDNMRALAFGAEFPVPGRTHAKGYQGYTWVRLDQLVYYFFGLRLTKKDEIEMGKILEIAQKSRDGAFSVSVCLTNDSGLNARDYGYDSNLIGFAVIAESWFHLGADLSLSTSFDNYGMAPAQASKSIGNSVEKAVAESWYERFCYAPYQGDIYAATFVTGEPLSDLEDGLGPQTVPIELGTVPFEVINDFMNAPYNEWEALNGRDDNANPLLKNHANALGSTSNPRVMTNLQASLNRKKSRIRNSRVIATANQNFARLANNPKTQQPEILYQPLA
ncbi:hypothetical protein BPOR_0301g00060 [Botrytis porri]|uniref:Uncharacterized protein n=1 Tax=Botrytis porri TaxID=87229 RepID=A0A4Z1KQW2_9HELO|nr:hypothetical protein BPOR_0301g00060 [Botrytis porri]